MVPDLLGNREEGIIPRKKEERYFLHKLNAISFSLTRADSCESTCHSRDQTTCSKGPSQQGEATSQSSV